MFGKNEKREYGRLAGFVGVAICVAAVAAAVRAVKRRSSRATTILKKDHRVMKGLFWTLQQEANPTIRQTVFGRLQNHIDVHSQVEEEIFYPAIRNLHAASAKSRLEQADREHQQIKDLCHQVAATDPDSYKFMSRANELKEAIDHHIEAEENEDFRLAQDHMLAEELARIGRRIHERMVQLEQSLAA